MVAVRCWLAALDAWAALNDSALDGVTQDTVSFGG
jgi:hypothetical protein